jgi:hypothetical protein
MAPFNESFRGGGHTVFRFRNHCSLFRFRRVLYRRGILMHLTHAFAKVRCLCFRLVAIGYGEGPGPGRRVPASFFQLRQGGAPESVIGSDRSRFSN